MVKFHIKSEINIPGIGIMKHEHIQELPSDNVFGQVAGYRDYMERMFPGSDHRLVSVEQIKEDLKC